MATCVLTAFYDPSHLAEQPWEEGILITLYGCRTEAGRDPKTVGLMWSLALVNGALQAQYGISGV